MERLLGTQITLGNGEIWDVPMLPGGLAHQRIIDLAFDCEECGRKHFFIRKINLITEKKIEAEEDPDEKDRLQDELNAKKLKDNRVWIKYLKGEAFEFLRALYEYSKGEEISEEDAQALFPLSHLPTQIFRARLIAFNGTVGEPVEDGEEDEQGSDFTDQEEGGSSTVDNGSEPPPGPQEET